MNLNECVINRGKPTSKKPFFVRNNKVVPMGPPVKPPPKKKRAASISGLNWGRSHISVPNSTTNEKSTTSKSSSIEQDGKIIVAVTEGRGQARFEVGIAAINLSNPCIVLCQISDTQSYVNSLTKINLFNPHEIIYPSTFEHLTNGNRLIKKLKRQFPNVKYTCVARKAFNKANGMEKLQRLSIPSADSTLMAVQHRYYTLAAASALLTHIQENLFIFFSSHSLQVEYQASEGYAIIDVATADRLELVCSAQPAQATGYSCLFDVINRCLTRVGARLLRSIILQPLYSVERIEERLELVNELMEKPSMLCSVQAILQKIPTIEQLLTISTINAPDTSSDSNRQLNYLLLLNSTIDIIEPLRETLQMSELQFFKDFLQLLSSEDFNFIRDYMREMVEDDAHPAKGTTATQQRVFAIKPGINGLLDLVRKTYSERVADMEEYVKILAKKYDLPLTLSNNNAKGYHIVFKLNQEQKRTLRTSDMPQEFIQVFRLAGSFTMKTVEMVNLSTRIDDIMDDLLRISNMMIHTIIVKLKQYIGLFYQLCDDVAYLDVLQSLAETSKSNKYVRPRFRNYTEVTSARHPILDFLCKTRPVSNLISSSQDFNLHIITGPNGAGKSIYIRQVLLLQIMAQVGCFVPAQSAIFRPADRMFARIFMNDDMEWGASSFVLEMKEMQYILETMTDDSLIIIDELCRSTAVEQGTAVAMGICERLAQTAAFTYITTHYLLLTRLRDICLNVKIWQMETIPSGDNPKTFSLDYKYALVPGASCLKDYGVYLVRNIWPDHVIKYIDEVLEEFRSSETPQNTEFVAIDERIRLKYNLESKFRHLKDQRKLTVTELNKHLTEYAKQLEALSGIQLDPSDHDHVDLDISSINHSIFDGSFQHTLNRYNPQAMSCQYDQYGNYLSAIETNDDSENRMWVPEVNLSYQHSDLVTNNNEIPENMFSPPFVEEGSINVSEMSDDALSVQMKLTNKTPFTQQADEIHYEFNHNDCSGKSLQQFNHRIRYDRNFEYNPKTQTFILNTSSSTSKRSMINPQDQFQQRPDKDTKYITENQNTRSSIKHNDQNNSQLEENLFTPCSIMSEDMNRFSKSLLNETARTSTPITRFHRSNDVYSCITPLENIQSCNQFQADDQIDIHEELNEFSKFLEEDDGVFEETVCSENKVFGDNNTNTVTKDMVELECTEETQNQTLIPSKNSLSCEVEKHHSESSNNDNNVPEYTAKTIGNHIEDIENHAELEPRKNHQKQSLLHLKYFSNCDDGKTVSQSSDIDVKVSKYTENTIDNLKKELKYLEENDECKHLQRTKSVISPLTTQEFNLKKCPLSPITIVKIPSDVDYSSSFDEYFDTILPQTLDSLLTSTPANAHVEQEVANKYVALTEDVHNSPDLFERSPSITYSPPDVDNVQNAQIVEGNCIESRINIIEHIVIKDRMNKPDIIRTGNKKETQTNNVEEEMQQFADSSSDTNGYETCLDTENIDSKNMNTASKRQDIHKNASEIDVDRKYVMEASVVNVVRLDNNINEEQKLILTQDKNITTSMSEACRKRNLDHAATTTSSNERSGSKILPAKTSTIKLTSKAFSKTNRRVKQEQCSTPLNNESSRNKKSISTSISDASRKRNLDQNISTTSNSNSKRDEQGTTTTSNGSSNKSFVVKKSVSTSISDASRKRNLDQGVNTSSNSAVSNKDSLGSSSVKESDGDQPRKKSTKVFGSTARFECGKREKANIERLIKKSSQKRFMPPFRKWTRKEISEEFLAQDKELLEMAETAGSSGSDLNLQKIYERRLNRPTVKQMQSATDLVTVRRTHSGIEVISEPKKPDPRRNKRLTLTRKLSNSHGVHMSIFSDKNAKVFDQYISSGQKDYTLFDFKLGVSTPTENSGKPFNFEQLNTGAVGEFTTNSISANFKRSQQSVFNFSSKSYLSDSYIFK